MFGFFRTSRKPCFTSSGSKMALHVWKINTKIIGTLFCFFHSKLKKNLNKEKSSESFTVTSFAVFEFHFQNNSVTLTVNTNYLLLVFRTAVCGEVPCKNWTKWCLVTSLSRMYTHTHTHTQIHTNVHLFLFLQIKYKILINIDSWMTLWNIQHYLSDSVILVFTLHIICKTVMVVLKNPIWKQGSSRSM